METPLTPVKSYIAYLNSPIIAINSSICCTELKSVQFLAYFCQNLVAMATPLAPSKIPIGYMNSPAPQTPLYMGKFLDFLQRTEISAILFLPKFFCPDSRKFYIALFEFVDPETPTIRAKIVSISFA